MINHQSFIGKIYGNLKVVGVGKTNKHRKKELIVQCLKHPNVIFPVVKQSLVNGSSKSCIECKRDRKTTHGMHDTREYHVYKGMIGRVLDPSHKDYQHYGSRGIDIDPRYDPKHNNQGIQVGLENFINDLKDLNLFPIADGLTLDRKDNNLGYWKSNIRLATMTVQQRNKRNNVVNEQIVKLIRADWATGKYTKAELARKHNLHGMQIKRIVEHTIWKGI